MADEISADDVQRALEAKNAQTTPEPTSTEVKQEVQPEQKEPEKPQEEPKPAPKEEPKKEFPQVPLIKFIQEEKRRKAVEAELEELKKQKAAEPQGTAEPKMADYEDNLYQLALKQGWTQEQYDAKLAEARAIVSPILNQLKEVSSIRKEAEDLRAQKEVEDYVDNNIDSIRKTIEADHPDMSDDEYLIIRGKIKNKILKEGLISTPVEMIYKASDEFRPKKKSVEVSGKGKTGVKSVDLMNPNIDDIKSGAIDANELLNRWRNS
jgi:hypothetical protein